MIPRFRALCIVFLLVLIVTPFTAPFSTCRVTDLFGGGVDLSSQALVLPPSSADGADDSKATVHARTIVAFWPLALVRAGHLLALEAPGGARQPSFTVIRV